jgi:hypothetical protein
MKQQHFLSIFNFEYLFFFSFLLILGCSYHLLENSFWLAHDNLNSEIIFKYLPVRENVFFSLDKSTMVKGYLGEVNKLSYSSSPFSIISWLFYLLPPGWALLIISLLGRILAFFGLYYLVKSRFQYWGVVEISIAFFLSAGFAFLPFYMVHGWTILGLPLVILIFNKFNEQEAKLGHYFVLLFYGLGSSFVLGGFAVIFIFLLLTCWIFYFRRDVYKSFAFGVIFLSFGLILSDIGLFIQFLFDHEYVSHRSIWIPECDWPFKVVVYDIYNMFFHGHYHAPSLHWPLLMFIALALLIKNKSLNISVLIKAVLGLLVFTLLLHALYKSKYMSFFKMHFEILNQFQFDRFYFLLSVIWIFLFIEITRMIRNFNLNLALISSIIFASNSFYSNDELISNVLEKPKNDKVIEWKHYYYSNLEEMINDEFPDRDNYYVINYGLDAAQTCLLGFNTIDGYHTNYPLNNKLLFIDIAKIKEKSDVDRRNNIFNWGSNLKYFPVNESNIELDWELAKKSEVRYILSRYQLSQSKYYSLIREYFDEQYNQSLFVYEIL